MVDTGPVLEELSDLVGDRLQVVTYKWLARHSGIPYDTAKRVLFEFFTQHSQLQKVKATFLVSGWTKGERQHVVRLVDGAKLETAKGALGSIAAMHIYSVQPGVPKDSADLYNADYAQSEELFRSLLSGAGAAENNPLASNMLSAVRCPGARRDPALAGRRPAKPAAAAAAVAAAEPTAAAVAAAGGVAGPSKAAGEQPSVAAAAQKPTAAAAPATAVVAAVPKKEGSPGKGGKKAAPPGKGGGKQGKQASPEGKKGSAIAQMWSKVPAKPKPAGAAAAAGGKKRAAAGPAKKVVAAAAAVAAAAGDSDSEDAPAVAAGKGRARQALVLDASSSDESDREAGWEVEEEAQELLQPQGEEGQPSSKRAKATALNNSDFEDDFEPNIQQEQGLDQQGEGEEGQASPEPMEEEEASLPPQKEGKPAAKKEGSAEAKKKRKKGEDAAGSKDAGAAGEDAPPSQAQRGPKYGTVKVRESEPGAKRRRREARTYYNDKGEEVTEMVEVEESEGEWEAPAPAPAQQQEEQAAEAQQPAAAAAPAAQAAKPTAGKANGASKGSGGGGGGKKKGAPAGQKSIASFFAKK